MRKIKLTILKFLLVIVTAAAVVWIIISFSNSNNIPSATEIRAFFGLGLNSETASDYVRFIDVGQGDSALIHSNGKTAVIDTGTPECSNMLGKHLYLSGVRKVDVMMLSHGHDDHIGAMDAIGEKFKIDNLIIPDIAKTEAKEEIRTFASRVKSEGAECYTAVQGMNMSVGDFDITVLAYFYDEEDENDRSVFAMVRNGERKFLFTGDAEKSAEARLLEEKLNLDCDVLKAGHHGSKYSSTTAFLESCSPQYAVVSCGEGNQYSHPHEETLTRFEKQDIEVYRTDINGDITFEIDENDISVVTEK